MPVICQYQRQHSVTAKFNDSSKTVTFTILATTSDYEMCYYPSDPAPSSSGQRCAGVGSGVAPNPQTNQQRDPRHPPGSPAGVSRPVPARP